MKKMPELIHEIEQIAKSQYAELRKALHGEGQFSLTADSYSAVVSGMRCRRTRKRSMKEHFTTVVYRQLTARWKPR